MQAAGSPLVLYLFLCNITNKKVFYRPLYIYFWLINQSTNSSCALNVIGRHHNLVVKLGHDTTGGTMHRMVIIHGIKSEEDVKKRLSVIKKLYCATNNTLWILKGRGVRVWMKASFKSGSWDLSGWICDNNFQRICSFCILRNIMGSISRISSD